MPARQAAPIVDDIAPMQALPCAGVVILDADKVETKQPVGQFVAAHEMLRGLADAVFFARRQGGFGQFIAAGAAGFHFDKDQRRTLFGNHVQLARAAAVIALQNAQAVRAQKCDSAPLAFRTAIIRGRARVPAQSA